MFHSRNYTILQGSGKIESHPKRKKNHFDKKARKEFMQCMIRIGLTKPQALKVANVVAKNSKVRRRLTSGSRDEASVVLSMRQLIIEVLGEEETPEFLKPELGTGNFFPSFTT